MPPPMAVRLAADLRPSADGSAVRTWLSCRQPACLQPRADEGLVVFERTIMRNFPSSDFGEKFQREVPLDSLVLSEIPKFPYNTVKDGSVEAAMPKPALSV